MSSLSGGGVPHAMLNLAGVLAEEGYRVDLLVCHIHGAEVDRVVPPQVRLVALDRALPGQGRWYVLKADPAASRLLIRPVLLPFKSATKLCYLPALTRYLRQERPLALLSAMTYCNLVAIWGRRLAGAETRIVVSEHSMLSCVVHRFRHRWRWRYLSPLVGRYYREADAVVAVSSAVAKDLASTAGLNRDSIYTVANPVVNKTLLEQAQAPLDHPWLQAGNPPVVLGACRLVPEKDLTTLLHAFAQVRAERAARLMILGEGPERRSLEQLTRSLGIANDVELPGWIDNPYPYMARAGVLVSSSLWEGLSAVLIQAMACGCPVVATNCPGGPSEVLDNGVYGKLVSVGDAEAMAKAIVGALGAPDDPARLKTRANEFTAERAAHRYLELLLNRQHTDSVRPEPIGSLAVES